MKLRSRVSTCRLCTILKTKCSRSPRELPRAPLKGMLICWMLPLRDAAGQVLRSGDVGSRRFATASCRGDHPEAPLSILLKGTTVIASPAYKVGSVRRRGPRHPGPAHLQDV